MTTATSTRADRAHRFVDYLWLPKEVTAYERAYLARMNRLALVFFWMHPPVLALVAWLSGTSSLRAIAYSSIVLVGPTFAYFRVPSPRAVSTILGVTSMLMGGLLVHFGQGPMQIEMHFYFFVLLALQAVFANPTVILASAVTVALHHLVLFFVLPASVFNYEASVWTVLVHALFVVLESAAACFVARSFFDDVIGLERLVQGRTLELDARNRDLQLVLDHVEQGLVTVDLAGRIVGARSAAIDRWFGRCASGLSLAELVEDASPAFAQWLRIGVEDLASDIMPRELTLSQLPRELSVGGRELRFAYLPIEQNGRLDRLLVVISDATAILAQAATEREERDLGRILERNAKDPTAVSELVGESDKLVAAAADTTRPLAERLRALHTLKGNASVFGLLTLAALVHEVEERVTEDGGALEGGVRQIQQAWAAFRARLEPLLHARDEAVVRVPKEELLSAAESIVDGTPPADIAQRLLSWTREPVGLRFDRMKEQASHLAERLAKPVPTFDVQTHGVRLPRSRFASLWNVLVHAIRNAIDHGLETPDERTAAGKSAVGRLELAATRHGSGVEIRIADDGRGIDWARVGELAAARGLPHGTRRELEAALFADGLSTRDRATDISGRGVGMAALLDAVRQLGGELQIQSEPGRGTAVIIRVPQADTDLRGELRAARRSLVPAAA